MATPKNTFLGHPTSGPILPVPVLSVWFGLSPAAAVVVIGAVLGIGRVYID